MALNKVVVESNVDKLFDEAREEVEEKVKKDAKTKIKALLQQRITATKVLKNIDRQIDDLRIKIAQDLG